MEILIPWYLIWLCHGIRISFKKQFINSPYQRWRRGHSPRGQGLWKHPRPRPRTELPRTDCLEAKDRKARG